MNKEVSTELGIQKRRWLRYDFKISKGNTLFG
jgi:hypothetical protein